MSLIPTLGFFALARFSYFFGFPRWRTSLYTKVPKNDTSESDPSMKILKYLCCRDCRIDCLLYIFQKLYLKQYIGRTWYSATTYL
jgi:hypothetical protein